MPQVRDAFAALNQNFPFSRAQDWDKVGLLVGDHNAHFERIFVCYEITPETLELSHGHELVICYHPLIFRPLENLDFQNPTAKMAATLIARGQSLICTHTALDGAPFGTALGDALARQLGLKNIRVGPPFETEQLVKIQTYAPVEDAELVVAAMWQAGAGCIGKYHEASFQSAGTGTFTPQTGADPFNGVVGVRNRVAETKIEVISPQSEWKTIVKALEDAHPYEEVAFEVWPLLNASENQRFGPVRVGEVTPQSWESFLAHVQNALQPPSVRLVKSDVQTVQKVACSPGSGASFLPFLEAGTVFVSGDFKHHDALAAQNRGVALLDVTHAATETATTEMMALALEKFDVTRAPVHPNPFASFPLS